MQIVKYTRVVVVVETYIRETVRYMATRWKQYKMSSENLNPSKHLNNSKTRYFNWSVIYNAPAVKKFKCKLLEVHYIALLKPTMNHIESDLLHLFKNGII